MQFHDLQNHDVIDTLTHYISTNTKPVLALVLATILEMDIFQQPTLDIITWGLKNTCYSIAIYGFVRNYWKEKNGDKKEEQIKPPKED